MSSIPEGKHYSVYFKGQSEGPFTFAEIRKKYLRKEYGGLHYLFHEGKKLPLSRVFARPDQIRGLAKEGRESESTTTETSSTKGEVEMDRTPSASSVKHSGHRGHWVWIEGKQKGPFSLAELRRMSQDGVIHGKTLLWFEASQSWRKIEDVLPIQSW